MSEQNLDLVLDLKGLLCPIPVVKISQAIKEIEVGEIIVASATDSGNTGTFISIVIANP